MHDIITRIKRKIASLLPFDSQLKRKYLFDKHLDVVRFKGENITLKKEILFTRSSGLVLGDEIIMEGGGEINATAGVLIGDKCHIDKNIKISSVIEKDGIEIYQSVIIGSGNKINTDIFPGTILPNKIKVQGLSEYKGQIVFVLSTGRSGSKAIAKILNQHPEAECYHEAFPHIYKLSCDVLYQREDLTKVQDQLELLYNSLDIGKGKVHGQSDQKLTPLVPFLSDLFPQAKFIWLIRKADSFVNSSYPRGWFANSEFNLPENPNEFFPKGVTPSAFDAAHRTNPVLIGNMSSDEWAKMTSFERNCWYWSYWNNLIEEKMNQLPQDKWLMVKLDELDIRQEEILEFLNLSQFMLESRKINKAKYKKITRDQWNERMESIYKSYCQNDMEKWFNIKV